MKKVNSTGFYDYAAPIFYVEKLKAIVLIFNSKMLFIVVKAGYGSMISERRIFPNALFVVYVQRNDFSYSKSTNELLPLFLIKSTDQLHQIIVQLHISALKYSINYLNTNILMPYSSM